MDIYRAPEKIETFEDAFIGYLFHLGIDGFGYGKARALARGFLNLNNIQEAPWPLLALTRGISTQQAQTIDMRMRRLSPRDWARYKTLETEYGAPPVTISQEIRNRLSTRHLLKTGIRIFSGPTVQRLSETYPTVREFMETIERIRLIPVGETSILTRREHQVLRDFYLVPENVQSMLRLRAYVEKHTQ